MILVNVISLGRTEAVNIVAGIYATGNEDELAGEVGCTESVSSLSHSCTLSGAFNGATRHGDLASSV